METTTAQETVELLLARLERIEFLVTGNASGAGKAQRAQPLLAKYASARDGQGQAQTVAARLDDLESNLRRLSSKAPVVRALLDLYGTHPTLFAEPAPEETPEELSLHNLRSVVLSSAPLFPTTVSSLQTISDTPVPAPELSKNLITLQPRIDAATDRADILAREVAALRQRSARLMERWMSVHVLAGGECWVEWDERLREADRTVRREEVRRRDDK